MSNQKAPPAKQESKTGKHGDFYVSVISKKDGGRTITEYIESKEEALSLKEEETNDKQQAHAYKYDKKEGKYVKIPN